MDELVKRLWECASGECFNCSQYTPTTNASVCQKELMKQAADVIEELQAAEKKYLANISALETENQHLKREREWMPVTEALPCLTTPVLVTDGIEVDIAWMYGVPPRWITSFTAIDEDKLTHWMPLPKTPQPPKEELAWAKH